ncbi:MAG: hypothetical protein JXB14_01030 [Candidatus Altiarchaeota archaeon]|nr:hypothetical protein [Candidatus Altiarchaeota archaeon]
MKLVTYRLGSILMLLFFIVFLIIDLLMEFFLIPKDDLFLRRFITIPTLAALVSLGVIGLIYLPASRGKKKSREYL